LILTHGWPGSVIEFLKVIPVLTDPSKHGGQSQDAFHVVCPALPGYGFSDKPKKNGWSVEKTARAWSELMLRLGYRQYYAQGGDWGAVITTAIALEDTEHCLGVLCPIVRPDPAAMNNPTDEEKDGLAYTPILGSTASVNAIRRVCPSASLSLTFISTPIRRIRSGRCARAMTGHAAAALKRAMNSRRFT
jgi:pimeloyl-ACP methyl ester carboxylesterase